MPSEFSRSPKLLKGALVVFETVAPIPTNLIVFQYNPDGMVRGFQSPTSGAGQQGGGNTAPTLPPLETFQMDVELDAVDQLESSNPLALVSGIHPTLAALELLLYPASAALILNKVLSLAGSAMLTPARAPMVLLVWGPFRVIPVRVASLTINEQAFDQLLNPIRAKVTMGLRALTIPELAQAGPPFDTLALVNHIAKEVLARANIFNSIQTIGTSLSF
ncbi:MAG TPA: hypothetical protein VIV60_14145 [Polyangiaceae bacterium]